MRPAPAPQSYRLEPASTTMGPETSVKAYGQATGRPPWTERPSSTPPELRDCVGTTLSRPCKRCCPANSRCKSQAARSPQEPVETCNLSAARQLVKPSGLESGRSFLGLNYVLLLYILLCGRKNRQNSSSFPSLFSLTNFI